MRICYFVHDLGDAAVVRRVELLRGQGASVSLAGFRRRAIAPQTVGGAPAHDLGQTRDGRLLARVWSVLRHCLRPAPLRREAATADVLLARNLEALVLAARVRAPGQRLVYECLDIHRLLLGSGPASRLIRAIERWALRGADLLIVSSPAFLDRYFVARRGWEGPALLVENKVQGLAAPALAERPAGPPWVIGWFGMLRCRRTREILASVAAASAGTIRIVIAGKPSPAMFDHFAAEVAGMPGVSYLGAYAPAELPGLFARVHFVWAIDYFEEGLNSAWLLPNRLYDGLAAGAVPIALPGVETGRWLARHRAGVLLDEPARDLARFLAGLDAGGYARLAAAVAAIPAAAVRMQPVEARRIAAAIAGEAPAMAELAA